MSQYPTSATIERINKFLKSVENKSLPEVQIACMDEYSRAKKNGETNGNNREYMDEIGGLLFYIQSCLEGTPIKPHGISNSSFQNFKFIIEKAVTEKMLSPNSLDLFS